VQRRVAIESNRRAAALFAGLPRHYDLLAELLSFGQNRRWRRAMVDRVLATEPARVLDVASGTAGVAIQLARRGGVPSVVGVDLSEPMLARGRRNVAGAGVERRVSLVTGRAEELPFADATFDALTFTYLLRYVTDPGATLSELARVAKPGAAVSSLEFLVPERIVWRFAWWVYTRALLPALGAVGGRAWWRVGRFLGPSISGHYREYPVDRLVSMWREAGFGDVGARPMSCGAGLVMWGRRRG
jgi:demethylmenaquinone methyltransferase/2-methoxy-6-polyprenyl-1,4-benzoquinol methylase